MEIPKDKTNAPNTNEVIKHSNWGILLFFITLATNKVNIPSIRLDKDTGIFKSSDNFIGIASENESPRFETPIIRIPKVKKIIPIKK